MSEVLLYWVLESSSSSPAANSKLVVVSLCHNIAVYWFVTWRGLRYVRVFVIADLSVVCLSVTFVHPTQGGWNFRQYFFAILYGRHSLTFVHNFTEIVPGNPSVGGVKRKRGSKIERRHVRVSNLLMSFLLTSWQSAHWAASEISLLMHSTV